MMATLEYGYSNGNVSAIWAELVDHCAAKMLFTVHSYNHLSFLFPVIVC